MAWGLPVRAIASGKVVGCWNEDPDNPTTEDLLPLCATVPEGELCRVWGGGNQLTIQQDDGNVGYYAHLMRGTLPPSIFPACLDSKNEVRVETGQVLGRVGNSGTAHRPHLHIAVEDYPLAFHSGGSVGWGHLDPGDTSPFHDLVGLGLGRSAAVRPSRRTAT